MQHTTPRILTRSEIKTLNPTQYLISRIIPERGFVSLVAPPSSKKSFVAIDMAASIATGHTFFDRAVRKGNVLYCIAEGQAGMQKRLRAWELFRGIEITESSFGIIPQAQMLNQNDVISCLVEAVMEHASRFGQIDLIIFDTLNRSLDGDENSARDMSNFVRGVTRLINELGTAVMVVHHPSKSGIGGARGHSALNGAVDVGLEIQNGGQTKFTLRCDAKPPKDDEPAAPLTIQSHIIDLSEEFGFDDEGQPITSLALEKADRAFSAMSNAPAAISLASQLDAALPSIIGEKTMSRAEILEILRGEGVQASDKTVNRTLRRLLEVGKLRQPIKGSYQCIEVEMPLEVTS